MYIRETAGPDHSTTTMCKQAVLLCLLLCAISTFSETNKTGTYNDFLKIFISSRRNQAGQLQAQVKLEEGLDKKSAWQVDIDHDSFYNFSPDGRGRALQSSTGVQSSRTLGPWYEFVPGLGYYKYHKRKKTWSAAKFICEKEGAHLAIVNSREEADILVELFSRIPINGVGFSFIGMTYIQEEGHWVTIFNEPLNSTGFAVWDIGQPERGNNCGGFNDSFGKLHALNCNNSHGFYCESEL